MVAGQLWLEIRSPKVAPTRHVAATIFRNVEHAIKAELGMGESGRRADKTWGEAGSAGNPGVSDGGRSAHGRGAAAVASGTDVTRSAGGPHLA